MGLFIVSCHRTKLWLDLSDAHGNSWNRFLSFSSCGDWISRTTESSSPLLNPLLNWKGTRALKLFRRYLIQDESDDNRGITSNVRRPISIPFPYSSLASYTVDTPATSSSSLASSCSFKNCALKKNRRIHRSQFTDSTTAATQDRASTKLCGFACRVSTAGCARWLDLLALLVPRNSIRTNQITRQIREATCLLSE